MKALIYLGFIIMLVVACKKANQNETTSNSDSDSLSVNDLNNGLFSLVKTTTKGKWKVKCGKAGNDEIVTLKEFFDKGSFCGIKSLTGTWSYNEKSFNLKLLKAKELTKCKTFLPLLGDIKYLNKSYDLTKETNYSFTFVNNIGEATKNALSNKNTPIISFCENNTVKHKQGYTLINTANEPEDDGSDTKTECDNALDAKNTCIGNNGVGTYMIGEGTYKGACENGKANGFGTQTYTDGQYYKGNFKDGLRDGQGTQFLPDGTEISGTWEAGHLKSGD